MEFMRLAVDVAEYYVYPKSMGVSMGNPLGPVFVNMFVGFHEILLFERHHKSYVYLYYVDDTFFSFLYSIEDAETFHIYLNSLHPSLQFIMEVESDLALPCLGLLVERKESSFIIGVSKKLLNRSIHQILSSLSPARQT